MLRVIFNAFLLTVVVVMLFSALNINGRISAKEDDLTVISKELKNLEANQKKIIETLEYIKDELKIIKVRATN